MATVQELERAFLNAHNAGDKQAAQALADALRSAMAAQPAEAPAAPPKDRTMLEAGKDILAGGVSGVGALAQLPGQLYGLATGDFSDTGLTKIGREIRETGEAMKSEELKRREAERAAKIKEAGKESEFKAGVAAFMETIKDPALLSNFIAEQVPNLIPGFAVARGLSAAGMTVGAVRGAIGTGAVQQGADIGAGAYEQLYKEMVSRGVPEEEAAGRALGYARYTGAAATVISALAQRLPGGRAIEEAMAKVPVKGGRFGAAVKGGAGETVSEMIEEGGGKVAQNFAMQQVDPTRSLTEGLGETMGMAAVGGAGLGTAVGLSRRQQVETLPREEAAAVQRPAPAAPEAPVALEARVVTPQAAEAERIRTEDELRARAEAPPVPEAEFVEGAPVPLSEEEEQRRAAMEKDEAELAKEAAKLKRGEPGKSLWSAIQGNLTPSDYAELGERRFAGLKAPKGMGRSISELAADGSLNLWLPEYLRMTKGEGADLARMEGEELTKAKAADEYIKDRLREGNYLTYETNFRLEQIGISLAEIESSFREIADVELANRLFQEAYDEQRAIDQEVEGVTPEAEVGGLEPPANVLEAIPEEPVEEEYFPDQDLLKEEGRGRAAEKLDTRTPEFNQWFGDSKVVDAQGKAMPLYHATNKDFKEFIPGGENPNLSGPAIWMTPNKEFQPAAHNIRAVPGKPGYMYGSSSNMFSPGTNVMPLYASLQNPLFTTEKTWKEDFKQFGGSPWALTAEEIGKIKDAGHDGIMYYDKNGDLVEVVAFNSNQVKSVFNKRPTEKPGILEEQAKLVINKDPEHARIEKELTGRTMLQAAQWAVDNAPNQFAKAIAQKVSNRLNGMAKRGIKLDFEVTSGERRPLKMSAARGLTEYDFGKRGEQKMASIKITLNGAAFVDNQRGYPPGTRYITVLHELLHAATVGQINVLKGDDPIVKELRDLFNKVVTHFNTEVRAGRLTPFMEKVYAGEINPLTGPDELVAWGIADRDMQEFLSEIKVGEQTIMDKLVELIRKILNVTKPYLTALDQLVKTTESILDEDVNTVGDRIISKQYSFGVRPDEAPVQGTLFEKDRNTKTPEFRKWFGKSQVVDENGQPRVVYHGMPTELEGGAFAEGLTFFSPNPNNAAEFARRKMRGEDAGLNIVPAYIRIQKPFDYRSTDPQTQKAIQGYLRDLEQDGGDAKVAERAIRAGEWRVIEDVYRWDGFDSFGFDGIVVKENGVINYAVLSPNQIKSVFNERPTEAAGILQEQAGKPSKVEAVKQKAKKALQKRTLKKSQFEGVSDDLYADLEPVFAPERKTIIDKIDGMRDDFWMKLAQGVADQYRSIKDISQEAYMKARMSKTIDGALEGILFNGEVKLTDGALDIAKDTKGLLKVLEPVGAEVDRYQIWVALQRDAAITEKSNRARDEISAAEQEIKRMGGLKTEAGKAFDKETKKIIDDDNLSSAKKRDALKSLRKSLDDYRSDVDKAITSKRVEIGKLKSSIKAPSINPKIVERRDQLSSGKIGDKSRLEVYKQVQKDMNKLNQSVLKIAKEQGIIDEEAYKVYARDINYIPFYKMLDENSDVQAAATQSGLVNQYFSKALKGGEKPFGDLMENTLRNWSHILSAAMKNEAANATIKAAMKLDGAYPNLKVGLDWIDGKVYSSRTGEMVGDGSLKPEYTTSGKGTVKTVIDGKPAYFDVKEPLLLESIMSIGYMGPKSKFLEVARGFKNMLQFGVTLSPAFKIRNLIRDSVSAMAVTDLKKNPFANVIQGWAASDRNNPAHISALAGGAVFNFGSYYEGDQAKLIKRLLDKGVPTNTILDTPEKIKKASQFLWNKYQEWGNKSESANRMALYKQLKEQGYSHLEASFYARDMLDFSMQGSWPAFRFLTQVVPFLNARVQGLYKLGRDGLIPTSRVIYNTATGKPIEATDKQRAEQFSIIMSAVALASLALYMAFKDDDEFKKREQWDRDNFWWFKLPGMDQAYRIPKPFEVGAFGTIAERVAEQIFDQGVEGKVFKESLARMLTDTFAVNLPQVAKPLVDLYANKDSFTGAPIETAGMERLSKAQRIAEKTSPLAIGLSEVANVFLPESKELSPVQTDYTIKAFFGWLGSTASWLSHYAVMPFSKSAYPDNNWTETLSMGFIKSLPATQSKYVTAFYENNKEISQAYADMRHFAQLGQADKVQEILKEKGDKIAMAKFYDNASKDMAKMRQAIQAIRNDENMTGAQKKEEIDRMKVLIGEIARQMEEARLEVKKSYAASQ